MSGFQGAVDQSATTRLTVAQAIVKYLAAQHTERDGRVHRLISGIFGIFGHGNVHGIGQALLEYPHHLQFLPARNEQAMVHMAVAYAKSERRMSTYACTASIGPGAMNMITGAALATVSRLPVLLLAADAFASRLQGPVLQQLESPGAGDLTANDAFRPVSRYFDRITRPEQLLVALPEACRVLTSPVETGAVVLSLPQDIQSEAYEFPTGFFETRVWRVPRRAPTPDEVDHVLGLIDHSEQPVIIAGGGVRYSGAEAELARFAEVFGIPVAETFAGKGSMSASSWLSLGGMGTSGNPAANEIVANADLVISLGTRMTDTQTGSHSLFKNAAVTFLAINVNEHDAVRLGATPVVADIRKTLEALNARASTTIRDPSRPAFRARVEAVTSKWRTALEQATSSSGEPLSQGELVRTLNEFAEPGDVVIGAAGTLPTDLLRIWDATGGKECYLEFGFSCMTHEIPAGVGVRLSRPDGQVYVLVGDGSFLMNPTEILTAVQLDLQVTFIVVENHGFRSIHGIQLRQSGAGDLGNEFRRRNPETSERDGEYLPVDLELIAEGLGATTFRARTRTDLDAALSQARDAAGPCVIVAEADRGSQLPESGAWREIPPAEVGDSQEVVERRATYETARRSQRFYY
jgi:3D-(3,5/4)-trihydroxycyclohexane-1,2-dione acylhydrolase (decyclizing)